MKYSIQNDRVSLCNKDTCLHVKGESAKVISSMLTLVTIVVTISAIAKAIK
ncbi:MAG: hypothetical protein VXW38_15720 [Bacteroidota bacterium]|nr:hypothetical protein [Bacteroidota bacterium]